MSAIVLVDSNRSLRKLLEVLVLNVMLGLFQVNVQSKKYFLGFSFPPKKCTVSAV